MEKKLKCIFQADILICDGRLKFDRFFEVSPKKDEAKLMFLRKRKGKMKVLLFSKYYVSSKTHPDPDSKESSFTIFEIIRENVFVCKEVTSRYLQIQTT